MEDVFESQPQLPKYEEIWDVGVVLDSIKNLTEELSLKMLTMKLCV